MRREFYLFGFPGCSSCPFAMIIVGISGLPSPMPLWFLFFFIFFLNKPGCPWRICLSRWDNWFRIPMPLFIITRSWFFKEYGFDAWWLAWCQASLLGIPAVWCSDAICRVLTRRSNTTSQASLGGPGRTVPSNHSDRVRRCHWTGRCALDTMLGAYKGI